MGAAMIVDFQNCFIFILLCLFSILCYFLFFKKAERVRGLVTEADALTLKLFLASVLHRPLEKLRISLSKKDFKGVFSGFDEVLEKTFVEHEEKMEDQGMDLMDILLEAYGDENVEYKITRNLVRGSFSCKL